MGRKFAIVTGGSRGIGAAMCLQLAKEGYNVVVNYVSDSSKEKAEAIVTKMEQEYGVEGIAIQADTSDYGQCEKIFAAATEKFGEENLSVLVNNSGIGKGGAFENQKVEDYSRVVNINLFSVLHNTHLALPYMIKNKGGNIINISSVAGLTGWASVAVYSATKAGIIGFTKSIAKAMGQYGIRVNCIAPGQINTDMTANTPDATRAKYIEEIALGRYGEPEEIAECMSYLLSAGFVTGQVISPNGGQVC